MIVSKQISLVRTVASTRRPLTFTLVWAVLVSVIHWKLPQGLIWMSPLPLTTAGVALGVLLGFRNTVGYSRYWEGRSLWGRLVNASRSFVRQGSAFVLLGPQDEPASDTPAETAERKAFLQSLIYYAIAFPHALRHHLRGEDPFLEITPLISHKALVRLQRMQNVPAGILVLIGEHLALARRRGWIDTILFAHLDQTLTEFAAVQGGCEKIRNTPIPPVYTDVGHKVTIVFCALLPFGLVRDLGPLMPPAVLIIAFVFLLLSRISLLLENPFGLRPNDLALTAICRVIEIDLRDALGESDVPKPIAPENGILL